MAIMEFFLALTSIAALIGIGYIIYDRAMRKQKADLTERMNVQLFDQAAEYEEQIDVIAKTAKEKNKKSLIRSKQIMTGKMAENLAPQLKGFKYNPAESHFFGAPIDFIVMVGSVLNKVKKIVFLEIKSGASRLTPKQVSIRKAIEDGEVYFETMNVSTDEIKNTHIEEMGEDCVCDDCY